MTKKAPNYSDEEIAILLAGYDPKANQKTRNAQVKALAAELGGRKNSSIIAKLTHLGVYVKQVHVAKDGKPTKSKAERVTSLAVQLGIVPELMDSLSNATVSVVKMIQELADSRDMAEHNLSAVLDTVECEFMPTAESE